jgi:hypothetical protein
VEALRCHAAVTAGAGGKTSETSSKKIDELPLP